jgi:hypothetical protein
VLWSAVANLYLVKEGSSQNEDEIHRQFIRHWLVSIRQLLPVEKKWPLSRVPQRVKTASNLGGILPVVCGKDLGGFGPVFVSWLHIILIAITVGKR